MAFGLMIVATVFALGACGGTTTDTARPSDTAEPLPPIETAAGTPCFGLEQVAKLPDWAGTGPEWPAPVVFCAIEGGVIVVNTEPDPTFGRLLRTAYVEDCGRLQSSDVLPKELRITADAEFQTWVCQQPVPGGMKILTMDGMH